MNVSEVFSAANNFIEYLKAIGIKFTKSAVIRYDSRLIEYRYSITLGNTASRSGDLLNRLKSKAAKPMEIGEVTGISILGIPANEDLSRIVRRDGPNTLLDIGLLFKTAASQEVIIQFNKKINEEELRVLIPVIRALRNPVYRSDQWVEIPIEAVVDHGREWKGRFDEIKIRDFRREYSLKFAFQELMDLFPESLRNFINSAKRTRSLDRGTIHTIDRISKIFRKFEDDEIALEAAKLISSDTPRNVQVDKVRCTVQEYNIHGRNLTLPGHIIFPIDIEIDAESLTLSAKMLVNIPQFNQIVLRLAAEAEKEIHS